MQAQIRQEKRFDKSTADAKAFSVRDYFLHIHEVVQRKVTKKLQKK